MLYWAEGEKDRNALRFYNSDPEMVRFFVFFLKKYFDLRDEEIKITCNLFADHVQRQREIEQFWLDVAQLSERSLGKSYVNVYSKHSKKKRTNRLPYGTVRVTVCRNSSRPEHLRLDPGVRRFRAGGLAGIEAPWPRARRTSTTES